MPPASLPTRGPSLGKIETNPMPPPLLRGPATVLPSLVAAPHPTSPPSSARSPPRAGGRRAPPHLGPPRLAVPPHRLPRLARLPEQAVV
ncbi:hypothetical protein PAHAL_7G092000 [Panicum hallii]|uniref:Uncharacterized protein n=1 Tax=Panicum hallii TaxID=206008 RepID=A0A2T8IBN5_9POAL|nr:hypothetical protein PAHAL_7G092000 [Panicum hallii]